jgi:hypothetical protein
MAEGKDQSKFIAGLRNLAEEHAANDPTFAKLRMLGKALVDETRNRMNQGETSLTLGSCLLNDSQVQMIYPATNGEKCTVRDCRYFAAPRDSWTDTGWCMQHHPAKASRAEWPTVPFIDVHAELVDGVAVRSAVPADISILEKGVPGVSGPSLPVYSKKVEPRIFYRAPRV